MLVSIDKIIVGDRIRKDFGDIDELAEDIKRNGLINPPTINKNYRLLAGERRLRACKSLGWTQIEVHMLDTKDEAHDLNVEMSENNMRRNFTGSELAEGIRRQMAIESEKAKERMLSGKAQDPSETFPKGRASDAAGAAFGISGKQAEKVVFVDDHRDLLDPADFANWDEGKLSTNKAYQRIKAAKKRAEAELEAANADLKQAWQAQEDAEAEAAMLQRKLESVERPEPEVVTKEVVREVVPEEVQQRLKSLEYQKNLGDKDNETLRRQLEETRKKLDRAKVLLGEKGYQDNASWDISTLTSATNQYLRMYGGKVWAFDQFERVDEVTQSEFTKAITSLAAFAQNIVQYISDKNKLEA